MPVDQSRWYPRRVGSWPAALLVIGPVTALQRTGW